MSPRYITFENQDSVPRQPVHPPVLASGRGVLWFGSGTTCDLIRRFCGFQQSGQSGHCTALAIATRPHPTVKNIGFGSAPALGPAMLSAHDDSVSAEVQDGRSERTDRNTGTPGVLNDLGLGACPEKGVHFGDHLTRTLTSAESRPSTARTHSEPAILLSLVIPLTFCVSPPPPGMALDFTATEELMTKWRSRHRATYFLIRVLNRLWPREEQINIELGSSNSLLSHPGSGLTPSMCG
ncbi:hypothetical protein QFZ40_003991 [Arthrobacter pascens]|nr:hypothetical protein [Arthrobacter pascens]